MNNFLLLHTHFHLLAYRTVHLQTCRKEEFPHSSGELVLARVLASGENLLEALKQTTEPLGEAYVVSNLLFWDI